MPFVPAVASGQIISSSAWGNLVGPQTVMRFTTAAQRTSQLTAPVLNQLTSLDTAPGQLEYWTGTAWAAVTGEISYSQVTAPTPITATTAPAATTVVTDTARSYDGSPVMIEFYTAQAQSPGSPGGASLMFNLWDAATDLGYAGQIITPAAAVVTVPVSIRRRIVPAAGSHTFRMAAWVPTGASANVGAGPGGINQLPPAFLRITRA